MVEGWKALQAYYKSHCRPSAKQFEEFQDKAREYYRYWNRDKAGFTKKFRDIVQQAEAESVALAKKELSKLTKAHEKYTENWLDATDMQRQHFKDKCVALEAEIEVWKSRTTPVSKRLNNIYDQISDLNTDLENLEHELPGMEYREKGEALRRVFKTVTLYWDKKFIPRSKSPTRPQRTDRPGRNSFTLLKRKIGWKFSEAKLDGSW
jgi:uncharacterized phage infection (PIP) family protein YhgE